MSMEAFIRTDTYPLPRYAFIPGSRARAELIASHLRDGRLVTRADEYPVFVGMVADVPMLVAATGMGGPTTAVCVEALGRLGADTFIRIGSCGTASSLVNPGDVLISTGAYRGTGTSVAYLPIEFPAVANFELTTALVSAAQDSGARFHVGLGSGEDAFYRKDHAFRLRLAAAGVISADMESDTLFVVATVRGWRAAALCVSDGTAKERKPAWGEAAFHQGEENGIQIALEAMRRIAVADRARGLP